MHKYFRNLKYKQKLERKYDNGANDWYPQHIEFWTKEPDEQLDKIRGYGWCNSCGYYVYWKRPSVSYSIHEKDYYAPKAGQTGRKHWYKNYSNRQIRRRKMDKYNRGQYKKVFDLWWILW